MKRFIAAGLVTLGLIAGLAPTANAFGYDPMIICNSKRSKDVITAFRLVNPDSYWILSPGTCSPKLNNYTGSVRVGIYGESYRFGATGKGYRKKCYNGPNENSNPPNGIDSITYKVYSKNRCKN